MNKVLKAFRKICRNLNSYEFTDEFKKNKKLIESAIKEYEMMKQTRIIVGCKNINNDDIEKLKSQSMFIGCLEKGKVELLFDEKTQKKLKALDFIKEHLTLITIKNGKQLLDINYWDDEEGFDLVKEILS